MQNGGAVVNLTKRRIVIAGAVACGAKAAARARRCDPQAEIVLVERGELLSYAGCGFPYYVGGSVENFDNLRTTSFGLVRDADYFHDVKDIDVRLQTEILDVDRGGKTVFVRNLATGKQDQIPYDKLVLATGAVPVRPQIEGIELDNVFTLHCPSDAIRIRQAIEQGNVEHATIIGAGLIGLELTESLFNQAVDATVVDIADQVLPSMLDPEIAHLLKNELVRDGLEFLLAERVQRIVGDTTVRKVVTNSREIKTDMVVLAVGVRPNVDLAARANLQIGETGAISVNEFMETSDPNIYAGGDCVECRDLITGRRTYMPLGSIANRHGRVIGSNAAGGHETFPGIVGTMVFKSLNLNVAKTGLTDAQARSLGYETVSSITPCMDHVHFYPGNKRFILKLVANRSDKRLLGAQLIGPGDVSKRVDILATALRFGATLSDVANLDLAYSPPFSHALDGVVHAANNTRNRIEGAIPVLSPESLKERLAKSNGLVLLDVREPAEVEKAAIPDKRALHIPLSRLRARLSDLSKDIDTICVCQQGMRGYEAATILYGAGFTRVAYLDGGLRIWPCIADE